MENYSNLLVLKIALSHCPGISKQSLSFSAHARLEIAATIAILNVSPNGSDIFPPCLQEMLIIFCNNGMLFSKVLNYSLLPKRSNRFLGHSISVITVSFLRSLQFCIFLKLRSHFRPGWHQKTRCFNPIVIHRKTLFAFSISFTFWIHCSSGFGSLPKEVNNGRKW